MGEDGDWKYNSTETNVQLKHTFLKKDVQYH